jgi:hypothetical protein
METLLLSLLIGTGLTFTLTRLLPWKWLMRFNLPIDILFTFILPLLFAGSFNGMTLAILSGIILSIELFIFKIFTPKHIYA